MSVLNASQIRWQSAALHALLVAESETRPWLENKAAVALIREVEGCTSQAAVGALKALLNAGLAQTCMLRGGTYWKATQAAERAYELLSPAASTQPPSPQGEVQEGERDE